MKFRGDKRIAANRVDAGLYISTVNVDYGVWMFFVGQRAVGQLDAALKKLRSEAAVVEHGTVFGDAFYKWFHREIIYEKRVKKPVVVYAALGRSALISKA